MDPASDQSDEDEMPSLDTSDNEELPSLCDPYQDQELPLEQSDVEELPSLSEGESDKEDVPSLPLVTTPPTQDSKENVSDSLEEEELPDLPSPSEFKSGIQLPKNNGVPPISSESPPRKKLRKKKSDCSNSRKLLQCQYGPTNFNNGTQNRTRSSARAENGNSHLEPVASTSSCTISNASQHNGYINEAETDTELDFGTLVNYPIVVDVSSGSESSEEYRVPRKRRRRPPVRRRNRKAAQATGGPGPTQGADVPIVFLSSDEESKARNRSMQTLVKAPEISINPVTENAPIPDRNMFEEPLEDPMRIRITYKGQLYTFEGSRTWRIQRVREELSRLVGVAESELMLYSDKEVQLQDGKSLDFYGIQLGDIIDSLRVQPEEAIAVEPIAGEDAISLKFQKEGLRKPLIITVNKSASLKQVRAQVARLLNANEKRLWLSFDGEMVDLSSTPEDLDLEDGCCIDLYEKQ